MDPTTVVQFSYLDLFMKADWVVKTVMIGLGLASVWSWAVAVDKLRQIGSLEKGAKLMEDAFSEGRGMEAVEEAGRGGEVTARVLASGLAEVRAARRTGAMSEARIDRTIEQMGRAMATGLSRELARAERGMGVLATIGSSAPFIGLFGTVWGIMTSFTSIAASKNTSLAVVAPGIAEALFATAIGLAAAIPAVIAYNVYQKQAAKAQARLESFADEFSAILSRQIDERVAA
jgi:biopolymer transport protein TolQ